MILSFLDIKNKNMKDKFLNFNAVYKNKRWTDAGGGSGPGSTIENTKNIRNFLTLFIEKHKIKSIIDVSVGGMHWWPLVLNKFPDVKFTGYDVSSFIIEKNKKKFEQNKNWKFDTFDASETVYDYSDLIICRHTFQHLSLENSLNILKNMKLSNSKFIALTSHSKTTKNPTKNNHNKLLEDTPGCFSFRAMNMKIYPFNMYNEFDSVDDDNEKAHIRTGQKLIIFKNK